MPAGALARRRLALFPLGAARQQRRPQLSVRQWITRYLLQARTTQVCSFPRRMSGNHAAARIAPAQRVSTARYLLAALGEASGICPGVEKSLKHPAPSYFSTDTAGAHSFLSEHAWLLEQAGFGVLLPSWWTRQGTKQRLGLTAQVKDSPPLSGGQGLTLDAIVQFNWQVALGDHTLSLRELETLARLKSPLVKVRGQWVQVRAEEIQAALDFWKKHTEETTTVRDLMKMSLGAAAAPAGLALKGVRATGWVGDFLAQLEGRTAFEELPPPAGLHGTLRPYQIRGYSWLAFLRAGIGGCLATTWDSAKPSNAGFAPTRREASETGRCSFAMSVVGNWKRGGTIHARLPVLIHHGVKRTRGDAFEKPEARSGDLQLLAALP